MITTLNGFFSQGTAAERVLYVPDPSLPAVGPKPNVMWQETDTNDLYYWDFDAAAWVSSNQGGDVTVVGTPTIGQIAEWTSASSIQGLAATGTGNAVRATSPTLVTPALGTPTAIVLTNATGFPTLNQNTTGSAATLTTPRAIYGSNFDGSAAITGPVGPTFGGTGIATYATGDLLYASATNVLSKLAAGTDTHVLTLTGGVPVWAAPSAGGTPGGADTQLQWNNAGAFGGISGVTTDGTNMTAGAGNLRATSPRITTSLFDANGLTVLGVSAVGSAVNYPRVFQGTVGNQVGFGAEGSDSNINVAIVPKGTGLVSLLQGGGAGCNINCYLGGTSNPNLSFQISGTTGSLIGQSNGVNGIATGALANELVLRGVLSGVAVSADNGASICARWTTGNNYEGAGSITTGAPSGGTAAAWKLGTVASVSPTSPNRTIELDVNGTRYFLAAKTTND